MRTKCAVLAAGLIAVALTAAPIGARAGLLESLGLKDSEEEAETVTYMERFEPVPQSVYDELLAKRPISHAIARSGGFGIVPSAELNSYVDGVLQRIVRASPVPYLQAKAFVLADQGFGARSTPDGSIYVNIGLLRDIASEDELAAVLAHELAHVLYRHHASDWFANSQKFAAQSLGVVDYAKDILGKRSLGESETTLLVTLGAEVSERVLAPNLWGKEQEIEADHLGLDMLIAANYLSSAALTALERLASYEAELHELAQAQMKAAQEADEADMKQSLSEGNVGQVVGGVVKGLTKLVGRAADATMDAVGGDHESAEKRAERLAAYLNDVHIYAPRPNLTALPWGALSHSTAAVLDHYGKAKEAEVALLAADLTQAENSARAAVSGPTKTDAYPRIVFSEVRSRQGDQQKSYKNLEIATQNPEPTFAVYRLMINRQLARAQNEEAVRLLDEADARLGGPPHLLPYRIAILSSANRTNEAYALLGQCKLSYPDLAPTCERALAGSSAIAGADGQQEEEQTTTGKLLEKGMAEPASAVSGSTGFQ